MDPFTVFTVAQWAIEALAAGYKIYERIQGANEKIDDAGTEIETNLSFLKEHFSKPRAELSPETLKRVNTRLKSIGEAAEEAAGILKLWQAYHTKRIYRKAFQAGPFPGRLESLSDKIEKNIERLRREYSGLAGGMTGPNDHTAIATGVPPCGPSGISPSVGFQPITPNQQQYPSSACLGPETIVPSRPSELYSVSGNLNNPVSLLSSSAPPNTGAPGGPCTSGYAHPHNPLAHPVTINSNFQLNNQRPLPSHSRPPLHHSNTTVPLMPPHQPQNAPSQIAPPPGYQHQRVGNSSSYPQPSAQPGVPSTQSLQPNGSNLLYSSGNVNGFAAAQPPPPYGMPVPSVHVTNPAAARPAASQPTQGTSHKPSNIPGQPQNYQNQPPPRQPRLENPPNPPPYQPQAPHGTGQGMYVPPPMQRPQVSQNAHMQNPNTAQWAAACAETSNQPQMPGTWHMPAPPADKWPQVLPRPQMQITNNAQLGGFAQSSNQPQVPRTGYMPAPPAMKQPHGPQTTGFPNNAHLGGSSAQPARQPQVPGTGHIPAPPATKPPQGHQRAQSSNQNSLGGSFTQSAHQLGVPRWTGQVPYASATMRTQAPQQNQFPNKAPLVQGPTHPQTLHSLPNTGFAGVSQHNTGPAAYVPGGMPNILNTSTRSSHHIQAHQIPAAWTGNTYQVPGNLSSAIGGGTGVQHRNSFSGMPGNTFQPGFQ